MRVRMGVASWSTEPHRACVGTVRRDTSSPSSVCAPQPALMPCLCGSVAAGARHRLASSMAVVGRLNARPGRVLGSDPPLAKLFAGPSPVARARVFSRAHRRQAVHRGLLMAGLLMAGRRAFAHGVAVRVTDALAGP